MKNQQGAPEALRLAEEWRLKTQREADRQNSAYDHYGMGNTPETVDPLGAKMASELRRLAALVEAQQPATHVQNPAVIEHVAGDVSKTGAESNMAQQPAPSAAAASKAVLAAIREANMQLVRTGDDEFMLVTYKNAKAQCDGGKCGIGGYCDDCPTPQADSQPAPVLDYPPLPDGLPAYDRHGKQLKVHWDANDMRAYVDADRAARAPADNVLEDAARLDWLEIAGPTSICVVIDRPHDSEVEVSTDDVTGYGKTLREALDAAREQGGAT